MERNRNILQVGWVDARTKNKWVFDENSRLVDIFHVVGVEVVKEAIEKHHSHYPSFNALCLAAGAITDRKYKIAGPGKVDKTEVPVLTDEVEKRVVREVVRALIKYKEAQSTVIHVDFNARGEDVDLGRAVKSRVRPLRD